MNQASRVVGGEYSCLQKRFVSQVSCRVSLSDVYRVTGDAFDSSSTSHTQLYDSR